MRSRVNDRGVRASEFARYARVNYGRVYSSSKSRFLVGELIEGMREFSKSGSVYEIVSKGLVELQRMRNSKREPRGYLSVLEREIEKIVEKYR